MTEQELIELEIEKQAYKAVISEFLKSRIDIRMSIEMDNFLLGLENKVRDIQKTIDQNT